MVSLVGGSNVNAIEVRLAGDATDLTSTLDEAAMAVQAFKSQIAALGAGASIAAAAGIAATVKAAESWNQVQREMAKVTSTEQARKLGDQMRELSTEIPVATNELGRLAVQAARFGIEGTDNIQKFTETVAKMASATDMATDEAGKEMAKLSELTNTPVSKMENLGSAIAKLENNFATSASEIVDASLRAGGTMARMGASQKQIIALSTALNEVNYSARRAGTGLRRVAQEMMAPGNVKSLAASLGLSVGKFKSMRKEAPTETMLMLAQAFKEGGSSANLLQDTLSTYATKTLSQLGQNMEGAREALNMSNEAFRKGTKLQEEYEIQTDSLRAQVRRLLNTLRDTAITIGNVFIPVLKDVIDKILPVLDAFDQWVESSDGVTAAAIMVTTALAGLVPVLGLLVQMAPAFTTVMTAGSAALVSLATSAAAVIAPLAAVAYLIQNNVAGIGSAISNIASTIGEEFRLTMIAFETLTTAVLDTVSSAWDVYGDSVSSRLRTIVDLLEGAAINSIEAFGSTVRQVIYGLLTFWQMWGEEIVNTTASFISDVFDVIDAGLASIIAAWRGNWDRAGEWLEVMGAEFVEIVDNIWDELVLLFDGGMEGLESAVRSSGLSDFWKSTVLDILDITEGLMSAVSLAWNGQWEDMLTSLSNVSEDITDIGERIFNEIRESVSSAMEDARGAVESADISSAVRSVLNDALDTAESIGLAIEDTLRGNWDDVVSHLETAWSNLKSIAETVWGEVSGTIEGKISDIRSTIESFPLSAALSVAFATIESVARTQFSKIVSVVSDIRSDIEREIRSWTSGVDDAIDDAFSSGPRIVNESLSNMESAVRGHPIISTIRTKFSEIQSAIDSAVSRISSTSWSDLQNGVNTAVNNVISELSKLQEQAAPVVSDAVSTISSEMSKLKSNIPEPVKSGLNDVESALNTHKQNITSTLSEIQSEFNQLYGDEIDSLKSTVDSALSKMSGWWKTHKSDVIGYLKAIGKGIIDHYKDKLTTLRDLVVSATDKMSTEWKEHKDDVVGYMEEISSQTDVTKEDVRNMSGPAVSAAGAIGLLTGRFGILGRTLGGLGIGKALRPLLKFLGSIVSISVIKKLGGFLWSLVKGLGKLKGPLKTVAKWFGKLLSPLKRVGVWAVSALAGLLPFGGILSSISSVLGGLAPSLTGLVAGLAGIVSSSSIAATVLGVLSTALTGVGAILGGGLIAALAVGVAAMFNFAGAGDTMSKAIDRIMKGFKQSGTSAQDWKSLLMDAIDGAVKLFNDLLDVGADVAAFFLNNLFEPIVTVASKELGQRLPEIIDEVYATLKGFVNGGEGLVNSLMNAWNKWGDEIIAVTKFVLDILVGLFDAGFDAIITAFLMLNDFLQGDFMEGIRRLAPFLERTLGGLVDFIAKWGKGLLKHLGLWEEWGDELTSIGNGIMSWLDGFINWLTTEGPKLVNGFMLLLSGDVTGAIKQFSSALDGPLAKAFQLAKDTISGLVTYLSNTNFKKVLGDIASWISKNWSDIASMLTGGIIPPEVFDGAAKAIKDAFGKAIEWIAKNGSDIAKKINQAFKNLPSDVDKAVDDFVKWVKKQWAKVVKEAEKYFGKKLPKWIGTGLDMAVAWAKRKMPTFREALEKGISLAVKAAKKWLKTMLPKWAEKGLSKVVKFAKKHMGPLKKWIGKQFKGIVSTAKKWIKNKLPPWIKKGISAAVSWFKKKLPGVKKWVAKEWKLFVKDAKKWILNRYPKLIKKGIDAITKWFKKKLPGVKKWVKNKWKQFVKDAKKFLKKKLPKVIKKTVKGVYKWFKKQIPKIKKWVRKKWKQFVKDAKKFLFKKLPKAIKRALKKVHKWFKKQIPKIKKWVKKKWKQFVKDAKKFLKKKLPKAIKQTLKKVRKWFKKKIPKIKKFVKKKWKQFIKDAKKFLKKKLPKQIKLALNKVRKWFKKKIPKMKKWVKKKWRKFVKDAKKFLFKKLPKQVKKGMKKAKKWIKKNLKKAKKVAKKRLKQIFKKAKKWLFKKAPKKVKKGMKKLKKWVKKQLNKAKKKAKKKVKQTFKKIKKFLFKKAPKKVKKGMKKLAKWVKQKMNKAKEKAKKKAKKAFNKIKEWLFKKAPKKVKTGMTNLKNFVKNKLNTAKNKAKQKVRTTYDKIKKYLFDKAPSKAKKGMNNVKKWVKNKLQTAVEKADTEGGNLVDKIETALGNALTKAKNWGLPGKIKSKASTAVGNFRDKFSLKGIVNDAISAAQNAIDSWTPDWPTLNPPEPNTGNGSAGGGRGGNEGPPGAGSLSGFTGFAHGGFVTSPTRAVIGEGRYDEAVLPMPKLRRLMNSAAEVGAQVGHGGGGGGITIEHVEINASSYAGGQAASRGFKDELRSHNFD